MVAVFRASISAAASMLASTAVPIIETSVLSSALVIVSVVITSPSGVVVVVSFLVYVADSANSVGISSTAS